MVCSSGATAEPVRRAVRAGERIIEHKKREEGARGREGKRVRRPIYREGEAEERVARGKSNRRHQWCSWSFNERVNGGEKGEEETSQ
jgi:hypothetical protein